MEALGLRLDVAMLTVVRAQMSQSGYRGEGVNERVDLQEHWGVQRLRKNLQQVNVITSRREDTTACSCVFSISPVYHHISPKSSLDALNTVSGISVNVSHGKTGGVGSSLLWIGRTRQESSPRVSGAGRIVNISQLIPTRGLHCKSSLPEATSTRRSQCPE